MKGRTNPLYSEPNSITEESLDVGKSEVHEVHIEIGDDDTSEHGFNSGSGSVTNHTDTEIPLSTVATFKPSLLVRQSSHDSGNESSNVHVHDSESCSSGSQDGAVYDDTRALAAKT